MIRRTEKLVITFHTTTAAMAMETCCRRRQAPGRLIPVPGTISAGCGLAWCAETTHEEDLLAAMHEEGIRCQGVYHCLI